MKINITPRSNEDAETTRFYRQLAYQINAISEGLMAGSYTARSSVPTTGTWAQGDEVKNSAPTELGIATAKYVIRGWQCVAGGTPATWLQQRYSTGN